MPFLCFQMPNEKENNQASLFIANTKELDPIYIGTKEATLKKLRERDFRILLTSWPANDCEGSKHLEEFNREFNDLFDSKNDLKLIYYKMIRLIEKNKDIFCMEHVKYALNKLSDKFFNETFVKRNIRLFLQILQVLTQGIEESTTNSNNSDISSALYMLNKYSNSIVPQELLKAIARKIQSSDQTFTSNDIGMSIYGFKNLNSQTVPKELLEALAEKIQDCEEQLSKFAIGNSLYGLNNLDITVVPKKFLEAISAKIAESDEKLDKYAISMSFYGLQNLNSSVVPLKLIEELAKKIQNSDSLLDGQAVSNILYGLKNIDSSVIPVDFFDMLAKKTAESRAHFNGMDVGNTLYGLQNLDESVITEKFLIEIERKLDESKDELKGQNIGNALYGLINFNSKTAISIKQKLFDLIEGVNLTEIDIKYFIQVYNLYGKNPPLWLAKLYTKLLKNCRPNATYREKEAYKWLKEMFPKTEIYRGHFVDGFELDIYFPKKKLNIELDGLYHLRQKGRDKKRDKYLLEKRGIKTIRIDLMNQDMMKLLEWIDPESRATELGNNMDAISSTEDIYFR